MRAPAEIEKFIADWRDTGGSELANTQSFINGLCRILGTDAPTASREPYGLPQAPLRSAPKAALDLGISTVALAKP